MCLSISLSASMQQMIEVLDAATLVFRGNTKHAGQMQALIADGEFHQTPPLSWFLCHSIHVIGFDSSIWPERTSW